MIELAVYLEPGRDHTCEHRVGRMRKLAKGDGGLAVEVSSEALELRCEPQYQGTIELRGGPTSACCRTADGNMGIYEFVELFSALVPPTVESCGRHRFRL